jgi:hypothetical protein
MCRAKVFCKVSGIGLAPSAHLTGRQLRKDKRGVIPAELSDILTRLDIEPSQWVDGMENFSRMFRRVAGSAAAILKQAEKAGRHWFQGINNARQLKKWVS